MECCLWSLPYFEIHGGRVKCDYMKAVQFNTGRKKKWVKRAKAASQ
jgi:hypothetical protein